MESGARQADPGEFTRRAFLNGKMDLSQAEAVSDIVSAGSERALRNSNTQLGGSLASRVHKVKDGLVKVCALIELDLDFSEEGERVVPVEAIIRSLDEGAEEVQSAISSFRFGKILRDGIGLAIVGRPNVGKSSIFNRLLQEERSIVSPVPGTTRDFLEETFTIDGLSVRLCDTAGLRVSRDDVEAEGIARTLLVTKSADVVLLVLDATIRSGFKEDIEFLRASTQNAPSVIIAINKADLAPARDFGPGDAVWISALTGDGFDELRSRIRDSIGNGDTTIPSEVHLTSYRQVEVLRRCSGYLTEATAAVRSGMSGEFVAADLRLAIDALSEITGEVTSDDILEHIFSRFCIGK